MAKHTYGQALTTLSTIPTPSEPSTHPSPSIPPALLIRVLRNKTIAHLGLTLVTSRPDPDLAAANEHNNAAQAIASRAQDPSLAAHVRLDTAAIRAREARVAEKRLGDDDIARGSGRLQQLRELALGHYEAVAAALEDRCRGVGDWETRAQALLGCEHVGKRLGVRTDGWVREALVCVEGARRCVQSTRDGKVEEGVDLEATADAVRRAMAKLQ
jgi:hypothetical protein